MSEVIDSLARHLQERLAAKEAECTLLAAHNRKLEEALRPFADMARKLRCERREPSDGVECVVSARAFARAAELVPETSPP